jgi:hypothetical protein
MPSAMSFVIIILLIILGSAILFLSIFGTELLKARGWEKLETLRIKFLTVWLTAGVIMLVGAFVLIVFSGDKNGNKWAKEQKEAMVKKIMESSIFVHGTSADTAKLVSECFIEKYTTLYTPKQMKEQNKLSNEELSKLTDVIIIECLKKYGLPKIDTSSLDDAHKGNATMQMHL